jgi:hypothetical protein
MYKYLFSIMFFDSRAVYETKWKIVVDPDWPQMTV